nr:hypothetical protein [Tanacetum cinerariifolium]
MLKRHSLAPAVAKTSLEDLMYEDTEEGKIVAEDRSKRKANGSLASDNVDTKRQKDHLLSSEHSVMVMKQINCRSTMGLASIGTGLGQSSPVGQAVEGNSQCGDAVIPNVNELLI